MTAEEAVRAAIGPAHRADHAADEAIVLAQRAIFWDADPWEALYAIAGLGT